MFQINALTILIINLLQNSRYKAQNTNITLKNPKITPPD